MCKHHRGPRQSNDRFYVDSIQHDNCLLCLVLAKGPMSTYETAQYLKLPQSTVSYLELAAMAKLRKRNPDVQKDLQYESNFINMAFNTDCEISLDYGTTEQLSADYIPA